MNLIVPASTLEMVQIYLEKIAQDNEEVRHVAVMVGKIIEDHTETEFKFHDQ